MIEDVLEQVSTLRQFVTAMMPGGVEAEDGGVWLNVEEFVVLQDIEERLQDCEDRLIAYVATTKEEENE